MKYIKYFKESFDPKLNKEVNDYVEMNKYNLPELWNDDLTEDENIEFMINYFMEYPDQMKTRKYNIKSVKKDGDFRNNAPILQNIGGVEDFRTFNTSF
jgi:excinuclease UvrABC nuclease subunit